MNEPMPMCCSAIVVGRIYEERQFEQLPQQYGHMKLLLFITTDRQPKSVAMLKKFGFRAVRKTFKNPKHHHAHEILTLWHAHPDDVAAAVEKINKKNERKKV